MVRQSGEDLLGFLGRVLELADLDSAAPAVLRRTFSLGSTFSFVLPLEIAPASRASATATPA